MLTRQTAVRMLTRRHPHHTAVCSHHHPVHGRACGTHTRCFACWMIALLALPDDKRLEAPQQLAQRSSCAHCGRTSLECRVEREERSREGAVKGRSGQGKEHVTRGGVQDIGTFSVATNLDDIKSAGEAAYSTINNDARKIPGVAEVRPDGRREAYGACGPMGGMPRLASHRGG
jgi:hypothetical protein